MLGALSSADRVGTGPHGKLDGVAFLRFVWREIAVPPDASALLPADHRRVGPRAIVPDNHAVHWSGVAKAAPVDLGRVGVGRIGIDRSTMCASVKSGPIRSIPVGRR